MCKHIHHNLDHHNLDDFDLDDFDYLNHVDHAGAVRKHALSSSVRCRTDDDNHSPRPWNYGRPACA
jgi:hypothetical protein